MSGISVSLKRRLSRLAPERKSNLRRIANAALTLVPHKHSLEMLCAKYGGDKLEHGYTTRYQRMFSPIRKRRMTILEIGVGGYTDPASGGESLRMWRDFFPRSMIYGIDIYDKHKLDGRRIKTFRGDQADAAFLSNLIKNIGTPDIIIDDGSHRNAHVLASFGILFPLLAVNGYYAIEDLYTSYWTRMGGKWEGGSENDTSISMLKSLLDSLNHRYIPHRKPSELDLSLASMHFYPKLAIIQKGRNELPEPKHVLDGIHLEED